MNVRRTWDKDVYEKRAKDRAENEGEETDDNPKAKLRKVTKEEFKAADDEAQGPMGSERAFLSARQNKVDLDGKVGKMQMINPTSATDMRGAGFWCDTCECLLKDSAGYLDHINGKKHQRALGFSMRVERADVSSVKERLEGMKSKLEANKRASALPKKTSAEVFVDYESKLHSDLAVMASAKEKLKKEKEAEKQRIKEEAEAQEDGDDEMAAMMGFGSFGGAK